MFQLKIELMHGRICQFYPALFEVEVECKPHEINLHLVCLEIPTGFPLLRSLDEILCADGCGDDWSRDCTIVANQ